MQWNSWNILAWFGCRGKGLQSKDRVFFNTTLPLDLHAKDDFATT